MSHSSDSVCHSLTDCLLVGCASLLVSQCKGVSSFFIIYWRVDCQLMYSYTVLSISLCIINVHAYVCIYLYNYIYTLVCVYIWVYIYAQMCAYIYSCVYIYIYTRKCVRTCIIYYTLYINMLYCCMCNKTSIQKCSTI